MNNLSRSILVIHVICQIFFLYSCKRPEQLASLEEPLTKEVEEVRDTTPQPVDKVPVEIVKPPESSVPEVQEIPDFPFERNITDSNGRKINAEILGKMDGKVALQRLWDEKRFVIPLEKLSKEDRDFFAKIPEGKHIPAANSKNGSPVQEEIKELVWLTDGGEAKKQSIEKRLPVYMLFTGSSWSAKCQQFESAILSSSRFTNYVDGKLILLKLDFPERPRRGGDHERDKLAKDFEVTKFPTFFMIDDTGRKLGGAEGYNGESVTAYIEELAEFINVGEYLKNSKIPVD